jgi:hypothetical protein
MQRGIVRGMQVRGMRIVKNAESQKKQKLASDGTQSVNTIQNINKIARTL